MRHGNAEISGAFSMTTPGEAHMKRSTKNRVRGKVRAAKGKVKETTGRLTGNPQLEDEGVGDQIIGKVQDVAGRVQRKLED